MATKTCRSCGEKKPADDFHIAHGPYRRADCGSCRNATQRDTYPDEKAVRRDKRLQKTYGITSADYEDMLEAQGGVCAICGRPPGPGPKQPLNVDHDHKTGRVRGLLCWYCNHKLLGVSRDNPELLRSAASYLESPPAVAVIGEVIAPPKPKKRRRRKPQVKETSHR